MRQLATVGHRAIALVVRGDDIVLESGAVSGGASRTFAENRAAARLGDSVPLQSTTGNISNPVAQKTFIEGKQAAILMSGVTGPRILWGAVMQGCLKTFVG